MNKIISVFLAALMMLGAVSTAAFAEDAQPNPIYLQSDFSSLSSAGMDFYVDGFECSMDNIIGYYTGRCFQAKKGFYAYDATCEVNLGPDEASPTTGGRFFNFIYNNGGEMLNGLRDGTRFMSFGYDIDKSELYLCADGIGFNSSAVLAGPIPAEGLFSDGSTYHKFGMSVTEQRIRCFIDGKLIFDYYDEENKYFIGYVPESPTEEAPIMLWWTENNLSMFKEIVVTEPEYLFPFPKPVMYGDANGDEKINLADVSLMLKNIAKWENLEIDTVASDVNVDEKLNLADVSRLLKYIAKWEYIVLGPHEKHSFSDWKLTAKPTLSEEGSKSRTCTECGETETEAIPMLTLDDIFKTYPDFVMRLGTFDSAENISDNTLFEWATSNDSGAYIESIVDDVNFIYTHKYDAEILNSFIEENLGVTIDYNKLVENNGSYYNTEFVYDAEAGIITVIYHGGFGYGYPEPIYNGYEKLDDSTYAVKFADYDSVEYVITLKETDNGFLILSFKRV